MIQVGNRRLKLVLKWLAAFGVLGIACYPIIISPMIDSSEYKKAQKIGRQGIDQEKIQPGNMRVWRDPFDRKKE